jgi:tRNA (guanine26-N2/guanine27-N2)-dimethyltransferase
MKALLESLGSIRRNATRAISFTRPQARLSSIASMEPTTLPDITVSPAVDQHICHEKKEYTTVKEGLAYILVPSGAAKVPQHTPKGDNQPQSVFYNPIQQFNRDLSVLAIKAYGEQLLQQQKKPASEKQKLKLKEKRERKRKREEDSINTDSSRKAGKLEAGASILNESQRETSNGEVIALSENDSSNGANTADLPTEIPGAQDTEILVPDTTTIGAEPAAQTPYEHKPPKQTPFTILDALSATGLRALRYAQEIPFTTSVTANDLLEEATKAIHLNVKHNKLEDKIKPITGNALTHMYSLVGDNCKDEKGHLKPSLKYNVIDLDPYGTAAPFLDAAVQAVRDDGGLLCVTCTDAGVWASNGYPEKAFSLYGGTPIKGQLSHEGGLRLILHSIASTAARYGLAMEPLLSLSIDFYARVFVRIYKSATDVKFVAGKTMLVYNCDQGCGAWTTQTIGRNKVVMSKKGGQWMWKHTFGLGPCAPENCAHCGMKTHIGGPMYAGPLHSPEFIQRILDGLPNVSKDTYQTTARIEGMLTLALEESFPPNDDPNSPTSTSKTGKYDPAALDPAPFMFLPSALAKVIHCVTPLEAAFRGALRHLGYRVTRSHTKPGSIKTNAPWDVVWEVMREWARQKAPIKEGSIRADTAGWTIMGFNKSKDDKAGEPRKEEGKKLEIDVVFDEQLGANLKEKKIVRYQLNPRENWGPMARAKGSP